MKYGKISTTGTRDGMEGLCTPALDKHDVIDQMNEEETARFIGLRNQVNYNNNLGGALALISRGTKTWRDATMREWNQYGYTADGNVR